MNRIHCTLAALAAWVALAPPGRAQVHVTGPNPQDFPTIQEAVDAAASGDVLLVAPGTYAGFTIAGKGITVSSLIEGSVAVDGTVRVEDVPWQRTVLLNDLVVVGLTQPFLSEPALEAVNCSGLLRVQDCTLTGGFGAAAGCPGDWGSGGHGAVLTGALRAAFVGCTLRGGDGNGQYTEVWNCYGGDGGTGALLSGSAVAFYDCHVEGGQGGESGQGGDGGDGGHCPDYGVFASGTEFVGGEGGFSDDFLTNGGSGGDGLYVDLIAQGQFLDSEFTAGAPGSSILGDLGLPGVALSGAGIMKFHPGPARVFDTERLVREGEVVALTATGAAGDLGFVLPSLVPDWKVPSPKNGIWLIPKLKWLPWPPALTFPGAGTQQTSWRAPSANGETVQELYMQGLTFQGPGATTLGSPMHVLVLDLDGPPDCDGNGVMDYLDLLDGTASDCNANLIPDTCDVLAGRDCNSNGVPDSCDIASGTSTDCDSDGLPDECQPLVDCNSNGVLDACDILAGTSKDLNGNGVPDECEGSLTLYVDPAAAPGGNGTLAQPFQDVQTGIDAAKAGDQVLLLDGTYTGPGNRDISFGGKPIRVASVNGPAGCVIDLEDTWPGFRFDQGESTGARLEDVTITRGRRTQGGGIHVAAGSGPIISGCVVTDCRATSSGGGGISLLGPGLVSDCTVSDCAATGAGGGILLAGLGRVERCQVLRNSATTLGGGISMSAFFPPGTVAVVDCEIADNSAGQGGGVWMGGNSGFLVLSSCVIRGNTAVYGGGVSSGFYLNSAGPERCRVENCLVVQNHASSDGGGLAMYSTNQNPRLLSVSCSTVVGNTADASGGGLSMTGFSKARVDNSILWGNSAPAGSQVSMPYPTTTLTVEYADVQGGLAAVSNEGGGTLSWGAGNLAVFPGFVAAAAGDFRLTAGSPCADAGNNALVPPDLADVDGDLDVSEPLPLDLDLTPRFVDDPVPDTGVGTPPLVDLGAYERP